MSQMQRQDSLSAENRSLREQLHVESELIGSSPAIKNIHEQIGRVAPTNATVLIRGESGSGKELVARAIHFSSKRNEGPFICLNCAAITETLLESELFGHERARSPRDRKEDRQVRGVRSARSFSMRSADGVQHASEVARVLEGHPFGASAAARRFAWTRRRRGHESAARADHQRKVFRRDLFYRLQVVEIQVPTLPGADVPMLSEHFLKRFTRETGRKIRGFTTAAMQKMEQYDWPGNVRELRNVIERAVALGRGPQLDTSDILLSTWELPALDAQAGDVFEAISLEELEKKHIVRTLEHTDWNKSQAATILQIERSTLDRKIKSYGLKKDES